MTLGGSAYGIQLGELNLTGEQGNGVVYAVDRVEGWGSPGSTIEPVQRALQHGSWAGTGYLRHRVLQLRGTVSAPTEAKLVAAEAALHAASALADTTLTVTEDATVRYLTVRRYGDVETSRAGTLAVRFAMQLIAEDPRKTADAKTGVTGLPSTSGGLTVPFTVPFTLDAVVVSGQVSLTNQGNVAGRVVARIDGPITAPAIVHKQSGKSLAFATTLTITAGNYVEIDMDARTILENGTASRNAWVTGRGWQAFEPGANTWGLSGSSAGSPMLTITAYPSWM